MKPTLFLKIKHNPGIASMIKAELKIRGIFIVKRISEVFLIVPYLPAVLETLMTLRTISNLSLVIKDKTYNPAYLNKHKSLLSNLIDEVTVMSSEKFKTFRISCAGNESPEIVEIKKFITQTYYLIEKEHADMRIHIIKSVDIWEIGVETTIRPLLVRDYRTEHMSGAMDGTLAAALCMLFPKKDNVSICNPCSGSGTLLIEAKKLYSDNIKTAIGFDNNKDHISIAKRTIKKAGYIKSIDIKFNDLNEKPNLGKFDVIMADLPFGMVIGKNSNMEKLYTSFFEYAVSAINQNGIILVYTTAHNLLESISKKYGTITESHECKIISNTGTFLYPKIYKVNINFK